MFNLNKFALFEYGLLSIFYPINGRDPSKSTRHWLSVRSSEMFFNFSVLYWTFTNTSSL